MNSDIGRNHLLLNSHNNSNGATDDDPRLLVSVDDHSLQPTAVDNGWTTSSKDHVLLNENFDFVPTITDPTQSLTNGFSGPVEGTLIDLVDDSSSSRSSQNESSTVTSGNNINRNHSPEKNLIEGVSSLVILDTGEPPEEQQLISTTSTTTQIVSNHQKRSHRRHHSSDHSDGDEDILCMYKSSSAADKQRLLIATEHHPSQSLLDEDGMDRESEPLIAYSSRGRLGSTDVTLNVSGKYNSE